MGMTLTELAGGPRLHRRDEPGRRQVSQMSLKGEIVNDPCKGEDTVANSLLVIRKPEGR